MNTREETIKAIEKYQKEHPLHFETMIDVTAISSKEGADIISQTIEKISKKVDQDKDIWCICEMAKMYMQGVKPVYPVRPQGEWIKVTKAGTVPVEYICSLCGRKIYDNYELTIPIDEFYPFCHCGADMRKGGAE